jgi:hypothetical protein
MRLLYKPFAIINGIISRKLGRSMFNSIWGRIDDAPPPKPTSGESTAVKAVAGQALQAGLMAGTAAAVDRAGARVFHYLIGVWPAKPQKRERESNQD